MAKYLDSTGLTHFWAKIKAYVSKAIGDLNLGDTYQAKEAGKGLSTNDYTTAEKNKLSGIAAGAEVNVQANWAESDSSEDSFIKNKPTIPSKTSDLTNDSGFITAGEMPDVIPTSQKGSANGVCPLDANSKIDSQYLPSYVDDVVEAYIRNGATALGNGWLSESNGGAALTPAAGKIYVIMNGNDTYPTNSQYRWGGTQYVKLNDGGVSAITNAEIDSITAN